MVGIFVKSQNVFTRNECLGTVLYSMSAITPIFNILYECECDRVPTEVHQIAPRRPRPSLARWVSLLFIVFLERLFLLVSEYC